MVRDILRGHKTQTRRVVKPQPTKHHWESLPGYHLDYKLIDLGDDGLAVRFAHHYRLYEDDVRWRKCPYGRPGDLLWVREKWADLRGMGFGNDPRTDKPFCFAYGADNIPGSDGDVIRKQYGVKWKPAIHMPREAARLFLTVKDIRVERLQDISEEDARAEGVEWWPAQPGNSTNYICSFAYLWDSINKEYRWDNNCLVWVVQFDLLQKGVS